MIQTVLVTGASSGLGAELARQYAQRGAQLVLLARRRARLEALAAELRALGAGVVVMEGDVTTEGVVAKAIEAAAARGWGIDVVYANAGFGVAGALQRLALDDYRRQFETNVFGLLRTVYEALPALRASRGRLVLVGSVNGYVASPGMSAYAMSKFAVRALAESLQGDLRPDGISVTLISPGFVDSDIRRTDNQGVLQDAAPDPIPAWLRVRTAPAVRSIIRAVDRRRPERVITGHGRVVVFLARHFPRLTRFISLRAYRGRPEPRNPG
jgi:short-subunit dehydrogenase